MAVTEVKAPGAGAGVVNEITKRFRENLQTYTIILALVGIWALFFVLTKGSYLSPHKPLGGKPPHESAESDKRLMRRESVNKSLVEQSE